jgi:hypothetical protein
MRSPLWNTEKHDSGPLLHSFQKANTASIYIGLATYAVKDVRGPVSTFTWVLYRTTGLSQVLKDSVKGIQEIWGTLNRLAQAPVSTVT